MILRCRDGNFTLGTFVVAAMAVGVAGCGAATTTTVTTAVTSTVTTPPRTVTVNRTVTAPARTVTATTPTTADQSAFVEQILTDKASGTSGRNTEAFSKTAIPARPSR